MVCLLYSFILVIFSYIETHIVCSKYPKKLKLNISARELNESKNVEKVVRSKSGKKIDLLCESPSEVKSIEDFRHDHYLKFHHVEARKVKLARINDYRIASQKIVASNEWKTFLSELQKQMQDSWTFHLLWPRRSGKNQLAYNLSHEYLVIYFDSTFVHDMNSSITRYTKTSWYILMKLFEYSRDERDIYSLLDQLFTHCLHDENIAKNTRMMHFFDNFGKFSWVFSCRPPEFSTLF